MFKKMSYKIRFLTMGIAALIFFMISPTEDEKKQIEKTKMEQLSLDINKIPKLSVAENLEAYKKLHDYYSDNIEYKSKYEKYKNLDKVSSYCLFQSKEINQKFLKNPNSYANEKYKYSKWVNEKIFIVGWEFTGRNALNAEYKFNSEYECSIKEDGSSLIKQTFLNQL